MYTILKKGSVSLLAAVCAVMFSAVCLAFFQSIGILYYGIVCGVLFLVFSFLFTAVKRRVDEYYFRRYFLTGYNKRIYGYYDRIRVSFSIGDFIEVIKSTLEAEGDFAVLWTNRKTGNVIYSSPGRLTSDPKVIHILTEAGKGKPDGIYYLGNDFRFLPAKGEKEAVLFIHSNHLLFQFSKYLNVFEGKLFDGAYREFQTYLNRVDTMEKMFSLSAISREWELVAETQKAFLPAAIPSIKGLKIGLNYEALVNVSGDYYDFLPISEDKTLFVVGDVSGKGLSAALIMGIIMNTIRIVGDKQNLETIVRYVDSAIKTMKFDGKFTALFLAIVDTAEGTITHVTAGIPEPWLLQSGEVHFLTTNCPLVGIIDIGDIAIIKTKFMTGDVMVISTDGLWELESADGRQLYSSPEFKEMLLSKAGLPVNELTGEIVRFGKEFSHSGKLRDDLAIMLIKAGE
ncbi:MAG: hypothetical protein A2Y33_05160 [Spirochaetes bacterium GWF1_51_8]|nr:MAG: hypothetical protein A2Y33_05160 [Spirochaetes bacterium GWF1_51_8]